MIFKRILGVFEEAARKRLSALQTEPEFNTELSIVSIVGNRGVGKSTVASLLSGNESMFVVGFYESLQFFGRFCYEVSNNK